MSIFLWRLTGTRSGGGGAPSYDTDAQAYFDAIVTAGGTEPNETRKGHINTLVTSLKTAGAWDLLLFLYLHAAHDSVAARVNLIDPSVIATTINSPSFSADQGYTGDGVSSYVDTSYTGAAIDRTNATIFVFPRILSTTNLSALMGWQQNYSELRGDIGNVNGTRVRIGTTTSAIPATAPSSGEWLAGRRSGTTQTITIANSVEGSVTVTDSAIGATNDIHILRVGSAYGDSQICLSGAGAWMTDTQMQDMRAACRTYLLAVGAIT